MTPAETLILRTYMREQGRVGAFEAERLAAEVCAVSRDRVRAVVASVRRAERVRYL